MKPLFALLALLVLGLFSPLTFAQDQPMPQVESVEQCRILVMVVRGQLLSAQDAWAFWAYQKNALQQEIDKLRKEKEEAKERGVKDE